MSKFGGVYKKQQATENKQPGITLKCFSGTGYKISDSPQVQQIQPTQQAVTQVNQTNEVTMYRQKQAFKHHLLTKYSKLLEFNKKIRNEWRLTNFAKKKVLFGVCNMSDSEINEIEGIYRFRCYIVEFDEIELFELNEVFDIQKEAIKFETDEEVKKILFSSLMEERSNQIHNLGKSKKALRIPIMLDLRLYGQNPDMPVYFGNKVYELDDTTKANIARSYELVNPFSLTGERYKQMLNESKILRDSYLKELNLATEKPATEKPTQVRVLQKAKNEQ